MRTKRSLSIILVALAIVFCSLRLVRLGQKLYWVDEVATSEHIIANNAGTVANELALGNIQDFKQVTTLIQVSDAANFKGTIANLVETDPHHTPPYYLVLNLWSRLVGRDPARLRLLSAIFSVGAVPALYWLALELFKSHTVAGISIWIYALSPFELIYAQQAREYSMWILLMLLSSASLMWALRRRRFWSWFLYFLLTSAMLWTHLLSIWVLVAHAAFISIQFRKSRKTLISFGLAAGLSFSLLAPWLIMLLTRPAPPDGYGGIEEKIAPLLYAETFLLNLSRTLLDVGLPSYQHLPYFQWHLIVPIAATITLICFCIWLFLRSASLESRVLLLLLAVSTMLPLFLADFALGGRRALLPRYDAPTWISLDLILAFSIASSLSTLKRLHLWAGSSILFLIFSCGSFSQLLFFSSTVWWTSRPPEMAKAAVFLAENRDAPLAIDPSSVEPEELISLAYFLHERPLIAINGQDSNVLDANELLVYRPGDRLINEIEASHRFSIRKETAYISRLSHSRPIHSLRLTPTACLDKSSLTECSRESSAIAHRRDPGVSFTPGPFSCLTIGSARFYAAVESPYNISANLNAGP